MLTQKMHCDPHARFAKHDEEECHVLLTMDRDHSLAMSTSSNIQTLQQRFTTWSGGDCAANKINEVYLDDILLMPRHGELPLQVVRQPLLGGLDPFACESDLDRLVIPIPAGVPCSIKSDSGDPLHHWMTSEEFVKLVQDRKKAFQEKGGSGVAVSTTLLANHLGTQAGASKAVEHASTVVWQAHVSSQGSMIVSKNESVRFRARDLAIFKEMLDRGEISTLAQQAHDYWSAAQRQSHALKCMKGGGCKKRPMTGASEKGVASKEGPMTGTALEEHMEASEKGGGSQQGSTTGTALEEHLALMAQGHTAKHSLMMQLANGKKGRKTCGSVPTPITAPQSYITFAPRTRIRLTACVNSKNTCSTPRTGLCRISSPQQARRHSSH